MFAIPSATSYYFTAGRRYKVYRINDAHNQGHIKCDYGHTRAIGLEAGKKSAHLWYAGKLDHKPIMIRDEDDMRWAKAGHFTFED